MEGTQPEIVRHYESIEEGRRITEGLGQLELLRTQEVICRHLPSGPLRILDVGGATGVHAGWLAEKGHDVHVVDLMPQHVRAAGELRGERGPGRITAEVADARRLPAEDDSFDVCLLFGPLYHLTERTERLRAWSEVRRVVRPNGLVFAAAISRFASLFDGLARGFVFDPEFRAIVEQDLRDGQHRNPKDVPHWFTTAFFHEPGELRAEAEEVGLEVLEVVGVEGLAGWLPQLADRLETESGRETILFAARAIEGESSLIALSAHLLLAARETD